MGVHPGQLTAFTASNQSLVVDDLVADSVLIPSLTDGEDVSLHVQVLFTITIIDIDNLFSVSIEGKP